VSARRRLVIRRTWAGVAGVVAALFFASAAHAATPVLKAMVAPSTAHAGDVVSLKLTAHNASGRVVKRLVVSVTLVPGDGTASRRVHTTRISRLRARATTTAQVAATIPATGAPATFTLHVCIGKRCLDTHPITLLAGDAYDRITSALAAGKLTVSKAALYEMQAAANSPDVPPAYRNTAPGGPDTPGLIALDNWSKVSAKDRAALLPYFLPPTYAQSIWAPKSHKASKPAAKTKTRSAPATTAAAPGTGPIDNIVTFLDCSQRPPVPAGDWSVSAAAGGVVIHGQDPGDSELAAYLASQVSKIRATLITSDGFPAPLSDKSCDAHGDGRLDVYLVPASAMETGTLGLAFPTGCKASPGYILIRNDRSPEEAASTLAHEFFHIEQAATGVVCGQPDAWVEGAAKWAEDEVYPKNIQVHGWPQWSYDPNLAMKSLSYAAWPFWYWLRHQYGAAKIATLFTTLRSLGFDQAVRQAPGGNFVDAFRDYAMYLWNQYPIAQGGDMPSQSFDGWDDYTAAPLVLNPTLTLGGAVRGPTPDTYRTAVSVPPLSIRYVAFTVPAGPIKQVTVENEFAAGADVGVDLFANTTNAWRRINLTTEGEKSFCEDKPDEDISHSIIAVSNAGTTARQANVDVVVGTRCKPFLQFDGTSNCDAACAGAGNTDWDWSGSANLEIDPRSPPTSPLYDVVNGSVTATIRGSTADGCTFSGLGTIPLNAGHDTVSLDLNDEPPSYQFSVILFNEPITVTYAGCDPVPAPVMIPIESVPFAQTPGPVARDPSATTLEGTNDAPEAAGQPAIHQHWKIGL
jgi:hypothetical protein